MSLRGRMYIASGLIWLNCGLAEARAALACLRGLFRPMHDVFEVHLGSRVVSASCLKGRAAHRTLPWRRVAFLIPMQPLSTSNAGDIGNARPSNSRCRSFALLLMNNGRKLTPRSAPWTAFRA
jgi:hypothetical protein